MLEDRHEYWKKIFQMSLCTLSRQLEILSVTLDDLDRTLKTAPQNTFNNNSSHTPTHIFQKALRLVAEIREKTAKYREILASACKDRTSDFQQLKLFLIVNQFNIDRLLVAMEAIEIPDPLVVIFSQKLNDLCLHISSIIYRLRFPGELFSSLDITIPQQKHFKYLRQHQIFLVPQSTEVISEPMLSFFDLCISIVKLSELQSPILIYLHIQIKDITREEDRWFITWLYDFIRHLDWIGIHIRPVGHLELERYQFSFDHLERTIFLDLPTVSLSFLADQTLSFVENILLDGNIPYLIILKRFIEIILFKNNYHHEFTTLWEQFQNKFPVLFCPLSETKLLLESYALDKCTSPMIMEHTIDLIANHFFPDMTINEQIPSSLKLHTQVPIDDPNADMNIIGVENSGESRIKYASIYAISDDKSTNSVGRIKSTLFYNNGQAYVDRFDSTIRLSGKDQDLTVIENEDKLRIVTTNVQADCEFKSNSEISLFQKK